MRQRLNFPSVNRNRVRLGALAVGASLAASMLVTPLVPDAAAVKCIPTASGGVFCFPEGPPTPPRIGGPKTRLTITNGGRQLVDQGTLACTRAGEPLQVRVSITQPQTGARAAGTWSKRCTVALTNKNGQFATWKLVLTATGTRRFTSDLAVESFTYFRGQPLKKIFHGRGTIRLVR